MKLAKLLLLLIPLVALADVAVTTKAGGGYDLYRSSTKLSHWANKPECEAARDRDAEALQKPTQNYSCREAWDTYTVKYTPKPVPVDCVVSEWDEWKDGMTGACTSGMIMSSQSRLRTVTREAANGGAACPALSETRETHTMCGGIIPKVAPPPRGTQVFTTLQMKDTTEQVSEDSTRYGAFRADCAYSHMAYDDPIVFQGQPGASHLHVFFGNTSTDANSTQATLDKGNSTCRGGTANRSAYWVPAIIDLGLNQAVVPTETITYYKDGFFAPPLPINKPPNGLRMIGGNPVTFDRELTWVGTPNINDQHHNFECWATGIPNGRTGKWQSIPPCPVGGEILFELNFPNCWDGVHLDSADHRSHMAFPPAHGKPCPATHPVPLVQITFIIHIPVKAGNDTTKWRLASDGYGLEKPGGYSAHGDVIVDWDENVKDMWFKGCILSGADCHAHMLGDSKMLY